MTTPSTAPSWLTTAEQVAGYLGGLLTALSGASKAQPTASAPSSGLGLTVGISTPIDAIMRAIGDGLKLANTIEGAANTPTYLAAKAAQANQDKIDEINQAVEDGDLEKLRELSSL